MATSKTQMELLDAPYIPVDGEEMSALPKPEDVQRSDQDESDFEIEVIDDTPEEDRRPPKAKDAETIDPESDELQEEIKNYSENAKKRFDQLTYQFHEERRQREATARQNEEAIRFAEQIARENQALKQALEYNNNTLASQMDERDSVLLESLRAKYKAAYEEGDTDALLEAQEKISEVYAGRMSRPQRAPPSAVPQQPQQRQPQQAPHVPVPDAKATQWFQNNPWFQSPGHEEMTGFAMGLHEKLVREGLDPSVHDEYYERINKTLHSAFPDYFGQAGTRNPDSQGAATASKQAPVAAPTRGGKSPRKVQLTSTQIALAKRLGLTKEQYAAQVAKEMTNG